MNPNLTLKTSNKLVITSKLLPTYSSASAMKYQRNTDHIPQTHQFKICSLLNLMVRWDWKHSISGLFDSNHAHAQRWILGNKIDFWFTIPSASNLNFQQACGSICGSVEGHRLLSFWETRFWLMQVQLVRWWHVWQDDSSVCAEDEVTESCSSTLGLWTLTREICYASIWFSECQIPNRWWY